MKWVRKAEIPGFLHFRGTQGVRFDLVAFLLVLWSVCFATEHINILRAAQGLSLGVISTYPWQLQPLTIWGWFSAEASRLPIEVTLPY